jgi:hypothetical protein
MARRITGRSLEARGDLVETRLRTNLVLIAADRRVAGDHYAQFLMRG